MSDSESFSVTIEQMREAAGNVHRNTISGWEKAGFFAGLKTSTTSHYRSGVRKFWQPEALDRVRAIAAMKAKKYSTAAILLEIGKMQKAPEAP
jgi:hypothetical protein